MKDRSGHRQDQGISQKKLHIDSVGRDKEEVS